MQSQNIYFKRLLTVNVTILTNIEWFLFLWILEIVVWRGYKISYKILNKKQYFKNLTSYFTLIQTLILILTIILIAILIQILIIIIIITIIIIIIIIPTYPYYNLQTEKQWEGAVVNWLDKSVATHLSFALAVWRHT